MASIIEQIVDYTAVLAATEIEGLVAVAAIGTYGYDDPLRAGHKIATAQEKPGSAMTHWSEAPGAPPVKRVSQDGWVEIDWTIPMRLWLPKQTEAARRAAIPFYSRYLEAFYNDPRLSNLVLRSEITRFEIGGDQDWSWLNIGLTAVERVQFGT